ncbi:hypothetical protein ACO0QE_003106 [Hanseniaspora vineae]
MNRNDSTNAVEKNDSVDAKNVTTYAEFVEMKMLENKQNGLHQKIIRQLEAKYFGFLQSKFATGKNNLHIEQITSTSSKVSKLQYAYFVEFLNKEKQDDNNLLMFYAYNGADITRLISLVERYQSEQQTETVYTQFNTFTPYKQQIETNELLKLYKTVNVPIFIVSLVSTKKDQQNNTNQELYKSIELTLVDQLGFNKQQLV